MMPIHTATLFTSLGFANVSSALQLFQQVPETGLERVLPEMEALDGALAAAGLQDGRDSFGWEAPKDLHARLCRLITGIDDPAAWKNVYRFSIQALKNQALRLDSPRTPISQHPLKEIVRKNGLVEKSRLSILVETGATEDQIRSIDPLSKRLRISLRGEEEGPNALKAFFALHMGMDLERMRVKASSNDLRKKSLVFPTEELLFVLDRLNLLGPRLIDRGTRKRLEFSLLAVRGALEEMRDHLSFAEGILQNFTAPEEQKSPPLKVSREIFGTLQLLLSNADKARTSCEEMWKASAPHIDAEMDRKMREGLHTLNEFLSEFNAQRETFLQSATLRSLMIEKARLALEEVEGQLGHLSIPEGELTTELDDDYKQFLKDMEAFQQRLDENAAQEEPASLEKAEALFAVTVEILGKKRPLLKKLENLERAFSMEEARTANGVLPPHMETGGLPEGYEKIPPLLEALENYTSPAKQEVLSPLDRAGGEATAALRRARREAMSAFGDEAEDWPSSLRDDLRHLVDLSRQIRDVSKGAADVMNDLQKKIEDFRKKTKELPSHGQLYHMAVSGLRHVEKILGPLEGFEEILWTKGGRQKAGREKTRDLPLLEQIERKSALVLALIEREKNRPFELTPEKLAALEEAFRKKFPPWSMSAKALLEEAKTLYAILPEQDEDKSAKRLYDIIASNVGKEGTFWRAHEAFKENYGHLQTERQKETPSLQKLKNYYLAARNAKTRAGQSLETARRALCETENDASSGPTLQGLVANPESRRAPKVYTVSNRVAEIAGRSIPIKNGMADIDGVRVPLEGHEEAQDRKLSKILETLALSPTEENLGANLAHPLFAEKVRKRIESGLPLRELKEVLDHIGAAAVYDHRFETAFYIPYRAGWFIDGARAMMPMFHGAGGARSTGQTMLAPAIRLRNNFRFNAIPFDTPNHGYGVVDTRFHDLQKFIAWADSIINYFRFLSHGTMPLVPIGRSHGDNVLQEHATRHAGKMDGMILVSGYDTAWTAPNWPALTKRIADGDFIPQQYGFPMVMAHEGVLVEVEGANIVETGRGPDQWTFLKPESDEAVRQTPGLHMSGTEDPEYKLVADFYRQREARAKKLGHGMLVVEGGEHDLLALGMKGMGGEKPQREKERIALVYGAIETFVSRLHLKSTLDMLPQEATFSETRR